MYIRFTRPSLLFWCATAFASLTACATQSPPQQPQLPSIPAHLGVKTDGTRELVVDRGGLIFSGNVAVVRKHVHKGKGSHFLPRYEAILHSSDGQIVTCHLSDLKNISNSRCEDGSGTRFRLLEQSPS